MKPHHLARTLQLPALLVAIVALLANAPEVQAQTFQYANGDLIVCFRQAGGASNLVVDIGPAANYSGLANGTVISVTNVHLAQLNAAFPSLNNVSWSVLGNIDTGGNTDYPAQTLWVTSPGASTNTPGILWLREDQYSQGNVAAQIQAIGSGAMAYAAGLPAGPNNTSVAIVMPASNANSYSTLMTSAGNLAGLFQGNVENTTASSFTGQQISRSGLCLLVPGIYPFGSGWIVTCSFPDWNAQPGRLRGCLTWPGRGRSAKGWSSRDRSLLSPCAGAAIRSSRSCCSAWR
jgi:hypothetical protein